MGDGLGALQAWFAAHCDGNWEQEYGVTIETVEEPGWELRVDLVGTRLEGTVLGRQAVARAAEDWCEMWCDGYTFYAVGGPHDLDELLRSFVSFAELDSAAVEA
jgi:Immunity protein 53